MNTTGSSLQQVQHAAGQKPVVKDSAAPATTHEAILARRVQPDPLDPSAPSMVQTFASPPPLLQKRSNVKRSYTSLIAMSPLDSLLPPSTSSSMPLQSATAPPAFSSQSIEAALASHMTPSPVVEQVITDTQAVADLCTVLNADEGVIMTNPDAPSLARSTLYAERCVTAKDVIGAIDNYWALEQLPNMELFTIESCE